MTQDHLAITYHNVSPLENMHAASLIRILLHPSHNFLSHLPKDAVKRIRKYMEHAIMCTDPASHGQHMAEWLKHAADWKRRAHSARAGGDLGASVLKAEAFSSLIGMMLKCADVMHMSQDFERHRHWVDALTEEFYQQGDREAALGMSTLPFMQRHNSQCLPSSQVQTRSRGSMPHCAHGRGAAMLFMAATNCAQGAGTVTELQRFCRSVS